MFITVIARKDFQTRLDSSQLSFTLAGKGDCQYHSKVNLQANRSIYIHSGLKWKNNAKGN